MTAARRRGRDEQGVDIVDEGLCAIDRDIVDEDERPRVPARGTDIDVGVLRILGARPRERQRVAIARSRCHSIAPEARRTARSTRSTPVAAHQSSIACVWSARAHRRASGVSLGPRAATGPSIRTV